jgi:isoleucyl-tRNA synthetase
VIDMICNAILKWFAPVLSFTCEEAWQLFSPNAEPSVHLTLFPEGLEAFRNDKLAAKWETIRNVRRVVTGALEVERAAKRIGSSLEAAPVVYVADRTVLATLFDIDLAEVCITSGYEVRDGEAPVDAFRLDAVPGVAVVVEKATGAKCARSWKILPTVGEDAEYPDVSPRDAQALREWKALGWSDEQAEPVKPIEQQPPTEQSGFQKTGAKTAVADNAKNAANAEPADQVKEGEDEKAAAADQVANADAAIAGRKPKAKKAKGKKATKAKTATRRVAKAKKAKAGKAAKTTANVKKTAKTRKARKATKRPGKNRASAANKKKKKVARKSSRASTRTKTKKKKRTR